MKIEIDSRYPSIPLLRERAKRRIPRFAFEYLDGGCNNEVNLRRNTEDIRSVLLKPQYLKDFKGVELSTELFGHTYAAPFGIAPIGLQGLMWPGASEILAKAAFEANLPFILSTVATADIETIAEITEGKAWFQLYHPAEDDLRDKIIDRCEAAGVEVLVVLADVPSFGYRPKEIRNGLSIPPKLTLSNMIQILGNPTWAINTLIKGQPEFKTIKPYIPKGLSLKHLGLFMNKTFDGRLNQDRVKAIRDRWKGKLVMKGVASIEDAHRCIAWGMDGVIISNHGGRQLDSGESTISSLQAIAPQIKGKTKIMIDSGMRSGPDIANMMASGAEFCFLGRAPMYGVSAMGRQGGQQALSILYRELQQVMQQLCCHSPSDLCQHLITPHSSIIKTDHQ